MNLIKLSNGNCFQHHYCIWGTEFVAKTIPTQVAWFRLQKRTLSEVPNLSVRIKAVTCRSDATLISETKLLGSGRHRASLTSVTQHYILYIRIEIQNFPLVLYKSLFWCSPCGQPTRRLTRETWRVLQRSLHLYGDPGLALLTRNERWCYL
jgi:hypothetical protein